ncbi:MAG: hypothetical protein IKY98_02960 [Alphaproteobacteria bacterium]|nr:hypothetical protein [Alphaproteobacteria bacterium]
MKKIFLAIVFGLVIEAGHVQANSRTINGITENEQLGMMAGLALACNAGGKLDDYELIASRILSNTAQTDADERKANRVYAEAKFKAYREHKTSPNATCGEVLDTFNHLPIFKSTVYADGTVKMPDGRILKPRKGAKVSKKPAQNSKKK